MNPLSGLMTSVAIGAVLFAGGAFIGYRYKAGQDAAAVLHQAVRTVKVIERSDAATTAAAVDAQATHDRIVYRTITLTKEIPVVLTPAIDVRFPLPVGFVRVHDSAALGLDLSAVPDAAGRPDDAAGDVVASRAATVIAANYGACHDDQARLGELQSWLAEQEKIHAP